LVEWIVKNVIVVTLCGIVIIGNEARETSALPQSYDRGRASDALLEYSDHRSAGAIMICTVASFDRSVRLMYVWTDPLALDRSADQ
jgi:hypothetical protein